MIPEETNFSENSFMTALLFFSLSLIREGTKVLFKILFF